MPLFLETFILSLCHIKKIQLNNQKNPKATICHQNISILFTLIGCSEKWQFKMLPSHFLREDLTRIHFLSCKQSSIEHKYFVHSKIIPALPVEELTFVLLHGKKNWAFNFWHLATSQQILICLRKTKVLENPTLFHQYLDLHVTNCAY